LGCGECTGVTELREKKRIEEREKNLMEEGEGKRLYYEKRRGKIQKEDQPTSIHNGGQGGERKDEIIVWVGCKRKNFTTE